MRLVFAGTPEVALPSLRALLDSTHEVVAVVTRPDAPAGRSRRPIASPVAALAAERGIEVLRPTSPRDPEFLARLKEIGPDACPVVAYGGLLPAEALEIAPWVNLHFSVLPAWRGAAPVQRALMAGDEVTGATVFRIVEELDAGPVYGVTTERIRPEDTAGTLLERLAEFGAELLRDVVDHLEIGDLDPHAQPQEGLSYAAKLSVADARIDWNRPAFAIDRHIRGCTPAPGAWTEFEGARLRVGPLTIAETDELAPGEVAATRREVRVGTGTQDVVLGEVQPSGKRLMPAADWSRGTELAGARLR
jgi:methionyl-tRNA formyltransferase